MLRDEGEQSRESVHFDAPDFPYIAQRTEVYGGGESLNAREVSDEEWARMTSAERTKADVLKI